MLTAALLFTVQGGAQSTGTMGGGGGTSTGSSGSPGSSASSSAVQAAQSQLGAASMQSSGGGVSADSYKGSLVAGKATGTTIDLSLDEAIQWGLRQNLGVILSASNIQNANGQRLEQLQSLLPTVTGQAAITVQQINLAAYGLKFPD